MMECILCGAGVTSKDPGRYPYCRLCHYTGAAAEHQRADTLRLMEGLLPGARVGIDHTGGGCFWMAVRFPDSDRFYAMTDGDAGLPDGMQDWRYLGRHTDRDDEHDPDYNGTCLYDGAITLATAAERIKADRLEREELLTLDPNETLKEIGQIIEGLHQLPQGGTIARLIEQVEALDSWITRGGFLPERWNKRPAASLSGKDVYVVVTVGETRETRHVEVLEGMPRWDQEDGQELHVASVNGGDSRRVPWWNGQPTMTVLGSGYALLVSSPTAPWPCA
jgi:hypothetical protein